MDGRANTNGGVRIRSAVLMAFLLLAPLALAKELKGIVVGVADGDTATVLMVENVQEQIRLAGIDAPEKRQPFGNVSKQSLSELVFGRQVTVDWNKRDRYGRIVGKIVVDGVDVCLAQLQRGLAWHYKRYESEQSPADRDAYARAESDARVRGLGLWVDSQPLPPWEWRKKKQPL